MEQNIDKEDYESLLEEFKKAHYNLANQNLIQLLSEEELEPQFKEFYNSSEETKVHFMEEFVKSVTEETNGEPKLMVIDDDLWNNFINTMEDVVNIQIDLSAEFWGGDDSDDVSAPMYAIVVTDTKGGVGSIIDIECLDFLENTYEVTYLNTIGMSRNITISQEDMRFTIDGEFVQNYAEHKVCFSLIGTEL